MIYIYGANSCNACNSIKLNLMLHKDIAANKIIYRDVSELKLSPLYIKYGELSVPIIFTIKNDKKEFISQLQYLEYFQSLVEKTEKK